MIFSRTLAAPERLRVDAYTYTYVRLGVRNHATASATRVPSAGYAQFGVLDRPYAESLLVLAGADKPYLKGMAYRRGMFI